MEGGGDLNFIWIHYVFLKPNKRNVPQIFQQGCSVPPFRISIKQLLCLLSQIKAFECRLCKSDVKHVFTIEKCYYAVSKKLCQFEHWVFATNSNFEIFICLQTDGGMTLGFKHMGNRK